MNYSLIKIARFIVSFAFVFLLINNYAHAEMPDSEKKPLIKNKYGSKKYTENLMAPPEYR